MQRLLAQGPSRAAEAASRELAEEREDLLAKWSLDPWDWLTGVDTTYLGDDWPKGKPIIWTQDEGDKSHPLKPWPGEGVKGKYLHYYIDDIWFSTESVIWVDKPRQIMATWGALLVMDWDCRFHMARRVLLSKSTEDEAAELLRDKPRFVHRLLPEWIRQRMPMTDKPAVLATYPETNSRFMAVAENVADRDARGGTTSTMLIDECARQARLESMIEAALGGGVTNVNPIKIIALTTAKATGPGSDYFKRNAVDVEFVA